MPTPDPIENAIAQGAARALAKRAAKLRQVAADGVTAVADRTGRMVPVLSPEARTKITVSEDLDEISADLTS